MKVSFLSVGNGERTLINRDSFYCQRVGEHGRFVTSVVTIAAMLARHGLIVATLRTFRFYADVHPTADLVFVSIAVLLLSIRRLISHWLLARVIDVATDVFILLYGVVGANVDFSDNENPAFAPFVASLALMAVILLFRLLFITSRSCDVEPSANIADLITFHLMVVSTCAVVVGDAASVSLGLHGREMTGAVAYMLAVTETIARMYSIHRYVTSNQSLRMLFLLVIAFDVGMAALVFGRLGDFLRPNPPTPQSGELQTSSMATSTSTTTTSTATTTSTVPTMTNVTAPTANVDLLQFAGAFVGIAFAILHLIVRLISMCMFAAPPRSAAVSRAPPLSVMPPKVQRTPAAPTPTATSSVGELKHMDSARSEINDSAKLDSAIFSTLTSSDEINPAELHDIIEFGKGSFGIVYRATYRHSEVAVKSINENAFGDDTDIVTEARTLSALPTHANVVAFRGHCHLKSGRPAIVLEFCEGGSLLSALRNTALEWTREKQIIVASGTAAGVAHLHKCGIVHRDIAARNVLLASLDSMIPKVTDFGMSRAEAEADSTLSSFGSAAWMAPEQLQSTRADGKFTFSMASDVFAFGVLLFEIFERKTPWAGFQLVDIRDRVSKGKRVEFDATKYPADVLDLMDNCWNFLPGQRPAMDTIATSLVAKRKEAASLTTKRKSKAATTLEPLQRDEYDDNAPLPELPETPLERNEYDQDAPAI